MNNNEYFILREISVQHDISKKHILYFAVTNIITTFAAEKVLLTK